MHQRVWQFSDSSSSRSRTTFTSQSNIRDAGARGYGDGRDALKEVVDVEKNMWIIVSSVEVSGTVPNLIGLQRRFTFV
jgi:hypothetical protein